MNTGLAGTGSEGEWSVELDEVINSLDLYDLTFGNGQFSLQVSGLRLEKIAQLQGILKTIKRDEVFHVHDAFGGRLELVEHDERLIIRIVHPIRSRTANLLQIPLSGAERTKLALALGKAIEDSKTQI